MKFYAALLILISSAIPHVHAQSQTANLDAWKKVSACGVIFTVPSDVQEVKSYPTDSCVRHYRGEDIDIRLDAIYSSHNPRTEDIFRSLGSDEPEFQVKEIQVAGVRSLIVTYYQSIMPEDRVGLNYLSKLLVPEVGKDKRGLMMWVYSTTSEGQVTAQRIFESISSEEGK